MYLSLGKAALNRGALVRKEGGRQAEECTTERQGIPTLQYQEAAQLPEHGLITAECEAYEDFTSSRGLENGCGTVNMPMQGLYGVDIFIVC